MYDVCIDALSRVGLAQVEHHASHSSLGSCIIDRAAAAGILDPLPAGYLREDHALAVLKAYGFPVPDCRLCRDADEAARLCAVHVRNAGRTGMGELAREEPVIPA